MLSLNKLLFQIELTRQKLEHVTREGDTHRTIGVLKCLSSLYDDLYQLTLIQQSQRATVSEPDDFKLVFADNLPDAGALMSPSQYRDWLRCNRGVYSYAVDVDPEMIQDFKLTGS